MTKCEYCGKEIGLLAVGYTWLDKQNNRAMHDKCLEEYKKNPERLKESTKTPEKTTEELGKEIAEKILNQPDRMDLLFRIFDNLPPKLTIWFSSLMKNRSLSNTHVEVDLSPFVDIGANIFPGDLVIRKNRDPRIEDTVEIFSRDTSGYFDSTVKVKKINFKEGKMFVYNPLFLEQKGELALNSMVGIVDKVIRYEDKEWEKIIKTLNIEYDNEEIITWIENAIEGINKSENFFDKEKTIKKLEEKIKIIKEHNKCS